jgi:hypothetical protein
LDVFLLSLSLSLSSVVCVQHQDIQKKAKWRAKEIIKALRENKPLAPPPSDGASNEIFPSVPQGNNSNNPGMSGSPFFPSVPQGNGIGMTGYPCFPSVPQGTGSSVGMSNTPLFPSVPQGNGYPNAMSDAAMNSFPPPSQGIVEKDFFLILLLGH